MNKPILYGTLGSPPVRACLLTAAAINLEIEFSEVNTLKKEHFGEDYLKKNPLHTIPTLEVNGKFICDSHAIIAYLVGKYAKDDSLYPKDLLERAMVDQRLHFDSSILFARVKAVVAPIIRREKTELVPKASINSIYEAYDFLEKFLIDSNYIAGNKITIADFSCVASLTASVAVAPLLSEKYPNIINWIKRIELLPYYAEKCGNGGKMLVEYIQKTLAELQEAAKN